MVSSAATRVDRLLQATGGDGACPECGGPDDSDDYSTYEVVWVDPGGPDDVEEWCESCGRQVGFVITWGDDVPIVPPHAR
jgi:hypothetical protein